MVFFIAKNYLKIDYLKILFITAVIRSQQSIDFFSSLAQGKTKLK